MSTSIGRAKYPQALVGWAGWPWLALAGPGWPWLGSAGEVGRGLLLVAGKCQIARSRGCGGIHVLDDVEGWRM